MRYQLRPTRYSWLICIVCRQIWSLLTVMLYGLSSPLDQFLLLDLSEVLQLVSLFIDQLHTTINVCTEEQYVLKAAISCLFYRWLISSSARVWGISLCNNFLCLVAVLSEETHCTDFKYLPLCEYDSKDNNLDKIFLFIFYLHPCSLSRFSTWSDTVDWLWNCTGIPNPKTCSNLKLIKRKYYL